MDKIQRIKELVKQLNEHSYNYYTLDKPTISDKQYDVLYDELLQLEKYTNLILSNSPTQKVQGQILPFLTKVKHTELMLSADKSKDINDIIKFMNNKECVLSWKLDGLTLVLKYNHGKFIQAVTRGGGEEGEDVTHTVSTFTNIPLTIDYQGYLEIRGEGLVPFEEFNRINNELLSKGEETYSSARNLASGSVRQLDANITKQRKLIFLAFGIVKCDVQIAHKDLQFKFLKNRGFDVVYHEVVNSSNIIQVVNKFKDMIPKLPFLTDGLIIEFNDIEYGKSQGTTGHHSKNMIALKHTDDSFETVFRGVELNTTRTGMVSITALFDNVDIDGVNVSRASLHNYDIFKEFELGVGDIIKVYRANSVIPQVEENLTRSNTYELNMKCPSCGSDILIKKPKEARFLYCDNNNCPSKQVQKIVHYCSKDALNIEGLSEKTIEKFIDLGVLTDIPSIYNINYHKDKIIKLDGFGTRSYNNLIKSIEKSKQIRLANFIYGLGIPNTGLGTAKILAKHFKNIDDFLTALSSGYDLTQLEDIGEITSKAIIDWWMPIETTELVSELLTYIEFIKDKTIETNNQSLQGKTFVITGEVHIFKNRNEVKDKIESLGGKVSGSVSKNTTFLINNDTTSTSGKNKKAKELNIPIISEEDFLQMIN